MDENPIHGPSPATAQKGAKGAADLAGKLSLESIPSYITLLWQMTRLAIPICLSVLVESALPIVTFLRVGHLGKEQLAAAALGTMLCNATAFATGFGLSTALDVTCAQAFGAKMYPLVGRQCQRMMVVLSLFAVPIGMLWQVRMTTHAVTEHHTRLTPDSPPPLSRTIEQQHSGFVFRALGLPLSDEAESFTRAMIPGLWPYFMFDCLRRYLSAQAITWPITLTAATTIVLHVPLSRYFVDNYGLIGERHDSTTTQPHGHRFTAAALGWLVVGSLVVNRSRSVGRLVGGWLARCLQAARGPTLCPTGHCSSCSRSPRACSAASPCGRHARRPPPPPPPPHPAQCCGQATRLPCLRPPRPAPGRRPALGTCSAAGEG